MTDRRHVLMEVRTVLGWETSDGVQHASRQLAELHAEMARLQACLEDCLRPCAERTPQEALVALEGNLDEVTGYLDEIAEAHRRADMAVVAAEQHPTLVEWSESSDRGRCDLAVQHWQKIGFSDTSAVMLALARWAPEGSLLREAGLQWAREMTNKSEDLV